MTSKLGWSCSVCGFDLFIPIGPLSVTYVGLYNDARFPGRCLVALRDHEDDFTTMSAERAHAFSDDIQVMGSVIQRVIGADRMNYAMLGNAVPHVHAHLIPRWRTDPLPNKAPWADPRPLSTLPEDEMRRIVEALRAWMP